MINFILALITVVSCNMTHTTTITNDEYTHTIVYNYKNEVVYEETTYVNDYYEVIYEHTLNEESYTVIGNKDHSKITYYNKKGEVIAFSEFDSQGNLMETYYYPRYYGRDSY